MVEQACVRTEFVTEAKLVQMFPCEASDVVLKNPDRLRAILLIIADHDDALCQQEED